ncbi:MAG: sle [Actinomycetia bacterium]|nr:sle [Actinomycetes bacterium]
MNLVATRRASTIINNPAATSWLFPGRRHGHPLTPSYLGGRLKKIGIQPGLARSTALFTLATELPAAILARMLGLHIKVAVAWQHASTGDWMTYAADVGRRNEPNRENS